MTKEVGNAQLWTSFFKNCLLCDDASEKRPLIMLFVNGVGETWRFSDNEFRISLSALAAATSQKITSVWKGPGTH